ncbi:MAG: YgiT-type zinc finger protein [Candidatus Hydrogenedentes bacterium]|nr:YgiT-type zinc finger protein [Candidatus Hydrogenedentota bacterium]
MTRNYADCYFCGGAVEERRMPREVRWQGQLLVFEDVPMGVCTQCSEKVLAPEVAKNIDRVLRQNVRPARTVEVPVYEYESLAASG